MDLEVYNAGKQDLNLENLVKKMDNFNEDLRQSATAIELRYKQHSKEMSDYYEKVQDLEASLKQQEAALMKEIESKEELNLQLQTTNMDMTYDGRRTTQANQMLSANEKQLASELEELKIEYGDLFSQNKKLKSDLEQKYSEIEELRQEISSLNSNLQHLMESNHGSEGGNLQDQIQQAFRNSLTIKKKAEDIAERRDSVNSTKSEYKDRIEELEEHLDQEREYIATLKMEMIGLRAKMEEMEDSITSRQSYNSGFRLDSNILEQDFEQDHEVLSKNVGSSLMEPGNRHVSVIRKVRDHKSIQVDLVMANVIKEADEDSEEEEDQLKSNQTDRYEIRSVVVEKQLSGKLEAQVQVVEDGVAKFYCLINDKVLLNGFGDFETHMIATEQT